MFRDKDYQKIIELTAPYAKHIITVETPGNPRALPAKELCAAVKKVNPSAEAADSVTAAVKKSLEYAGKDDAVIIFGSLSFLKDAVNAISGEGKENE